MKRKRQPSAILSSKDFETGSNSSDDYQGDIVGDEDYNPEEDSADNDSASDSFDESKYQQRCSFQCLFHLVRV